MNFQFERSMWLGGGAPCGVCIYAYIYIVYIIYIQARNLLKAMFPNAMHVTISAFQLEKGVQLTKLSCGLMIQAANAIRRRHHGTFWRCNK